MGMLPTIILDFETYYDKEYSLKKLSYPEYIRDDRFLAHGLGVDYGGGKQDFILGPDIAHFLPSLDGKIVVVHNAFFDAAILAWRYAYHPTYIIDTLGLANHVLGSARDGGEGRNDLDSLAERLNIPVRKKDLSFMLGVRDPSPGDLLRLQEYVFPDLSITRAALQKLLPRISNRDFELWLLDHTIRIYTDRLLAVDKPKVLATLKLVETRRTERVLASGVNNTVLSSNPQFAAELKTRLAKAKLKLPMKKGKRGMIPALAKADPAFIKLAEHPNDAVRNLVRGRLVERSATQALARLHTLQRLQDVGVPVHLVYYGAHTGRYAAGGGFNLQNLTSPDRATDPVDREIAASIRASMVAGEGFVFVAVDAAQIEARIVAWLAGEQSILDAFLSGADIYSQFISGVLEEDIHKPLGTEPPEVQQNLKLMRGVGKVAVLGLGYNMGVDKYMLQVRQQVPVFAASKAFTVEFAAKVVAGYRDQYRKIVKLWKDYDDAFRLAYRGMSRKVGPVTFAPLRDGLSDKGVQITLPSGRTLYYRHVRSQASEGKSSFTGLDGKKKTVERKGYELRHGNGQKVYGGLLAENVTQAIARDILVEAEYASEQAGYPVVLTIHDEVVLRVPQVQGQAAHDFLVNSLSTPPPWGAGLVLGAEGRITTNLGK